MMALTLAIRLPFRKSLLRPVQLRSFSGSACRKAQWGFIGLGQMGMLHVAED